MTNIDTALKFIDTASTMELNCLAEAIKRRRGRLNTLHKCIVSVGQKVTFKGLSGVPITGTVIKMAIKKAQVRTDRGVIWAVPFHMLQAA